MASEVVAPPAPSTEPEAILSALEPWPTPIPHVPQLRTSLSPELQHDIAVVTPVLLGTGIGLAYVYLMRASRKRRQHS